MRACVSTTTIDARYESTVAQSRCAAVCGALRLAVHDDDKDDDDDDDDGAMIECGANGRQVMMMTRTSLGSGAVRTNGL